MTEEKASKPTKEKEEDFTKQELVSIKNGMQRAKVFVKAMAAIQRAWKIRQDIRDRPAGVPFMAGDLGGIARPRLKREIEFECALQEAAAVQQLDSMTGLNHCLDLILAQDLALKALQAQVAKLTMLIENTPGPEKRAIGRRARKMKKQAH